MFWLYVRQLRDKIRGSADRVQFSTSNCPCLGGGGGGGGLGGGSCRCGLLKRDCSFNSGSGGASLGQHRYPLGSVSGRATGKNQKTRLSGGGLSKLMKRPKVGRPHISPSRGGNQEG